MRTTDPMFAPNAKLKAIRSAFFDFVDDPFYVPDTQSVRYIPDGLLVLEDGYVKDLGDYTTLAAHYPDIPTIAYPGKLIMPGFVDIHVHSGQTEMIGAYGEQLLDWLNGYAFPTEAKFQDPDYAAQLAEIFIDQLLSNGTTTAVVLATVSSVSAEAVFEAAQRHKMRMIVGKVMMDRNAPDFLLDTAQQSYEETKALIQTWHKCDRLLYAVTPRFAITSTPQQLQLAGKLLEEFPDVYMHTHLSENKKEIELTAELFPESTDYLNVYERFGLLNERSIFAHCIHLSDSEFERLSQAKAAIAFCPTSNLFLGSGLFKIEAAKSSQRPIKVGLATDVGGGTSFSMLQTASEAYKVAQLRRQQLSAFKLLFLATLGAARALMLDDKIGSFDRGKEADFIVLDPQATPLMALRSPTATAQTIAELAEKLFATIILGDDRSIFATYVSGDLAYSQAHSK